MDHPSPIEPVPLEGLSFDMEDLQTALAWVAKPARYSAGGCDRSSLRAGGSRNLSARIKVTSLVHMAGLHRELAPRRLGKV